MSSYTLQGEHLAGLSFKKVSKQVVKAIHRTTSKPVSVASPYVRGAAGLANIGYARLGDDIYYDGFLDSLKKVGKAVVSPVTATAKFVMHPIQESKAAITTIARFDPTAKSAKYGNITKGVLLTAAAVGAGVLTAGVGAGVIAGAGLTSAATAGVGALATKGIVTTLTPVKRSSSPSDTPVAVQDFTGVPTIAAPGTQSFVGPLPSANNPVVNMPQMQGVTAAGQTAQPDNKKVLLIAGAGVAALTVLFLVSRS